MANAKSKTIKVVSTLLVLVLFGWYVVENWSSFQDIRIVSPGLLLPAIGLYTMNVLFMGQLVEQAMKPHGAELPVRDAFGLSALTRFSKQFAPGYLGSTLRATYYKKNFGISYAKFSSSLILSTLLQLLVSGTIALATYMLLTGGAFDSSRILLICVGLAILLPLFYVPVDIPLRLINKARRKHESKILKQLSVATKEYARVRKHPRFLAYSIIWAVLALLMSAGALYFYYRILGYQAALLPVIFINCLTSWTTLFSITPSDIGVREGLMIFGAQVTGIPVSTTLAVAILLRVVQFAVVALLASYYGPKLVGKTVDRLKVE